MMYSLFFSIKFSSDILFISCAKSQCISRYRSTINFNKQFKINLYLGQYSIWNCIWHGWVAGYIFASAYSREALESKRLILFSTSATQIFFGARINGRAPEHVIMVFLDAIASPSTFPCQWVSQSVMIDSFRLEIAIASPSFASLLFLLPIRWSLYWYFVITTQIIRQAIACQSVTQESCDHWEIRVILRRPTETMTRSMTITTTMKMKYRGQNICSRWCPSYLWPLWEMFWSRHLKGRSELCVRTYVCGYVGNTFWPIPYPGTIIIETCQKEYNIYMYHWTYPLYHWTAFAILAMNVFVLNDTFCQSPPWCTSSQRKAFLLCLIQGSEQMQMDHCEGLHGRGC